MTGRSGAARAQLTLATISFAVCFAAWGLISAFAPRFRDIYHLTALETAWLVSTPVLLGSVARIPMGMLTDRLGGRAVYTLLTLLVAIPVVLVPRLTTYPALVTTAFVLGLAGSSFAVGVAFVSPWFPASQQGSALGVYGLGNIGQSVAVFVGPLLALSFGWQGVFRVAAAILAIWGIAFGVFARDPPSRPSPKSPGAMFAVLASNRLSWVLAAFYFLTFGGFVAFSIYLPTLLKDQFRLTPADAGF
ncbi:MAG TPA: MFS transporter, partial [Vicinamibacterales bacterium]